MQVLITQQCATRESGWEGMGKMLGKLRGYSKHVMLCYVKRFVTHVNVIHEVKSKCGVVAVGSVISQKCLDHTTKCHRLKVWMIHFEAEGLKGISHYWDRLHPIRSFDTK